MSLVNQIFKFKFFSFLPLFMLFFISFNGNSVLDLNFFSINLHYILVYYWTLRKPETLGYSLIFLSGIISDVIYGFPLGLRQPPKYPFHCRHISLVLKHQGNHFQSLSSQIGLGKISSCRDLASIHPENCHRATGRII